MMSTFRENFYTIPIDRHLGDRKTGFVYIDSHAGKYRVSEVSTSTPEK